MPPGPREPVLGPIRSWHDRTAPRLPWVPTLLTMPTSISRPCSLLFTVLLCGACGSEAPSAATAPTPVDDAPAPSASPAASPVDDGRAAQHLQRSIELEQQGDLAGARSEADAAVAAGGGRDATIQAAKIAILEQRYDDALAPLEALVKAAPDDATAQYDLALVRQHEGDYNRARNGYLAALRADPSYADARYNLAVLCSAHGFAEEAQHHLAKFRAAFPHDPRGTELERRLGGPGAAGPSGVAAQAQAPSP